MIELFLIDSIIITRGIFLKLLGLILDVSLSIVKWITIFLLSSMTLFLFFAVLSRYIFSYSFHWIDAYSRYGLVWLTFLGCALALRDRRHIGIDIIINRLSPNIRKWIIKITAVMILLYSFVMLFQGFKLFRIARLQIIPELQIKMSNIYIVIPFSALLLILVTIEIIISSDNSSLSSIEGSEDDG